MNLSILVFGIVIWTLSLSQVESVILNENQLEQVNEESGPRKDANFLRRRQPRQDEDNEEEEEDGKRKTPPLYPLLFNLFGTVIGANDTQVNKTVEKIVDRYNGIDPDSTTPLPTKPPPKGGDVEEEDEDEDTRRRNYW